MTDIIEECARAMEAECARDMRLWVERWTGPAGIYEDAPPPPQTRYYTTPRRSAQAVLRVLRDHLYINIEGLTAIKDAEERRK